jgi:Ca-activated chloride channel family protein
MNTPETPRRSRMRRFALAIAPALVSLGLSLAAPADGLIVIRDAPPGISPVPDRHVAWAPLEVRYHHVTAKVTGRVAVTEVDQVFFNPSGNRLEGTYLFPIPKGAQIDKFSMDVNGKMTDAELLDAAKARGIYEEIVRKMRDPALLEYLGQGLFKVRIYPIEPRSEKRVKLRYTELLTQEGGLLRYLYPLNTEKFSARPLASVSVKVDVELPEGIRTIYSPSHAVEVKRHGPKKAIVGFEAKDVRPDADFQLFVAPAAGSDVAVHVMTYREPGEAEGSFLLVLSPSHELAAEKVVRKDVVFVLDTSGSMAEGKKLAQAKKALTFCLRNLNEGDRFEVVRFSTETEPLFGRLVAPSEENVERAEGFVAGLKPIGGTAIEDALLSALEPLKGQARTDRPYNVVFLTDGKPTVGSTIDDEIVSRATRAMGERTVRVFSVGIGSDVNTHLLDRLSETTRAASRYVLPEEDLELALSSFYAKISQPVLASPRLKFQGTIRVTKLAPPVLPDLFRGEQVVVLGRYSGTGDAAITLQGTVNGTPRTFTWEASFPARAAEHAFVPRLWATRRVGFLLDQIRLHGESAELREEVTELARQYGIVTPYTAFLVLEDEERRSVPVSQRTIQAPADDGRARAAAGEMYKGVRETKSGAAAVGGAQALDSLKRAQNAAAPSASNVMAFGAPAGVAQGSESAPARVRQLVNAQATRFVEGRTFYQNGNAWIDANVQARKGARTRQVKFGSKEYDALLARSPEAAAWLALGRNVQVVLGGEIVEVVE